MVLEGVAWFDMASRCILFYMSDVFYVYEYTYYTLDSDAEGLWYFCSKSRHATSAAKCI